MKIKYIISITIISLFFITSLSAMHCHDTGSHNKKAEKNHEKKHTEKKTEEFVKQSFSSPELKVGDKAICPVMGSKFTVKKDTPSVTVKKKKYFVCCPMCVDKIKADPDKYLKDEYIKQTYKSEELKIGDKTICPVMGSKFQITKKTDTVTIKKKKYYVCCPSCIDAIKKDPDKYLK